MSLSVSGSRFVRVYDPSIDLKYSDKVIKARLVTSRKTGRMIPGENGQEREERAYSEFPAQFVGTAFEQAKQIHGQTIDILNGWIIMEKFTGRDNVVRTVPTVFISDFVLSNLDTPEENDPQGAADTVPPEQGDK
jgi:hypothetical protein